MADESSSVVGGFSSKIIIEVVAGVLVALILGWLGFQGSFQGKNDNQTSTVEKQPATPVGGKTPPPERGKLESKSTGSGNLDGFLK